MMFSRAYITYLVSLVRHSGYLSVADDVFILVELIREMRHLRLAKISFWRVFMRRPIHSMRRPIHSMRRPIHFMRRMMRSMRKSLYSMRKNDLDCGRTRRDASSLIIQSASDNRKGVV